MLMNGGLKDEFVWTKSKPKPPEEPPVAVDKAKDRLCGRSSEVHPLGSPTKVIIVLPSDTSFVKGLINESTGGAPELSWRPSGRSPREEMETRESGEATFLPFDKPLDVNKVGVLVGEKVLGDFLIGHHRNVKA